MTQHLYVAIVQRSSGWNAGQPPMEQSGFPDHAKYMAGLEATGFIAVAGLMQSTGDVLFILRADSEAEVRARFAQDPWQQDGHVCLVRVEEIHIRIGAPPPHAGA